MTSGRAASAAKRLRASLRFRAARLLSLLGRFSGSLARRGFAGTLARARQELRERQPRLGCDCIGLDLAAAQLR